MLSSFIKARWELLFVFAAFAAFTIPHLGVPFYVDEAWVYAPAVKTMALHGASLLPGSIPEDYSRGHPLMFHFLGAIWIKFFGTSNAAVHAYPWAVSVIFLVAIYECCQRLFGRRTAALALLLVATNVLYFAQTIFLLPEIMLAMFSFLSLYFYSRDRFLLTAVMLFGLFFTKEGGLIIGGVLGIDAVVALFRKSDPVGRRVWRLGSVAVPTGLIGLFFVIQKAKFGWYVLPLHSTLIHTDWNSFYAMFREALYWIFKGDSGNYVVIFFVMLLSVVAAVKQKDVRYLFLCLPAAIVYVLTNKYITEHTGDVIWVVLFAVFFAVPVYYILKLDKTLATPGRRFLVLLAICFVAHLVYLSFSVPAYRYLLVNVVLLLVFLAVCAGSFAAAGGKYLFHIAAAGVLLTGAYAFYTDEGNTDGDLESFHALSVQQKVMRYLEKENAYDKEIVISCYWALGHYTDTMQGFLSTNHTFPKANHGTIIPTTAYAVFDNICGSDNFDTVSRNPAFKKVYQIEESRSWAKVYKRMK